MIRQRERLNVPAHNLQVVDVLLLQRAQLWIFDLCGGENLRRNASSGSHNENQFQEPTLADMPCLTKEAADWQPYRESGHGHRCRDCCPIVGHPVHSALLFLRRVKSKVQGCICHFVFAQVVKHWHTSSVWHRRDAHTDGGTSGDLSNQLRQARPRGKSTKRWYRALHKLLGIGVRSNRVVADVTCRFYDLLTYVRGRLVDRYLFAFSPGDTGKLFQVSDQRPDLRFA